MMDRRMGGSEINYWEKKQGQVKSLQSPNQRGRGTKYDVFWRKQQEQNLKIHKTCKMSELKLI